MYSQLYLEADAHAGGGVGPEEVSLPALPVVLHADGPAQLLRQWGQEGGLHKLLLKRKTQKIRKNTGTYFCLLQVNTPIINLKTFIFLCSTLLFPSFMFKYVETDLKTLKKTS
jgi:hypothetical protein